MKEPFKIYVWSLGLRDCSGILCEWASKDRLVKISVISWMKYFRKLRTQNSNSKTPWTPALFSVDKVCCPLSVVC